MREHRAPLVLVQDLHHPGMEHDERSLKADRHGVRDRRLRDVQVPTLGGVQRLQHLGVQRVEFGALLRPDTDCVRKKELTHAALAEEAHDASQRFVEARQGAKGVQRGAIRWVLPRARRDTGEFRGHMLGLRLPPYASRSPKVS